VRPALRRTEDFHGVPAHMRVAARDEFNRTIREFRETGAAAQRTLQDFAHVINPPGADEFAYGAHRAALRKIRVWKESLATEQDRVVDVPEIQPAIVNECEEPTAPEGSIALRGETVDLEVTRHRPWTEPNIVAKLSVSEETRRIFRHPMPEDETEALLNAMIGEMHFNMREVGFRSMCQTKDLGDRMEWVNATIKMAECGAKVAESVARLRGFEEPRPRGRSRAKG